MKYAIRTSKEGLLTVADEYEEEDPEGPGAMVLEQETRLETVEEGHPGEVPKRQHEAKPIVNYVHRG